MVKNESFKNELSILIENFRQRYERYVSDIDIDDSDAWWAGRIMEDEIELIEKLIEKTK